MEKQPEETPNPEKKQSKRPLPQKGSDNLQEIPTEEPVIKKTKFMFTNLNEPVQNEYAALEEEMRGWASDFMAANFGNIEVEASSSQTQDKDKQKSKETDTSSQQDKDKQKSKETDTPSQQDKDREILKKIKLKDLLKRIEKELLEAADSTKQKLEGGSWPMDMLHTTLRSKQ